MPIPAKPPTPTLQTSHPFAANLVGAWLFSQSSGHTVPDFSTRGFHLSGTGYSDGSWGNDGPFQTFLHFDKTRLRALSAVSDYQHVASDPFTMIWHIRRTGGPAASFNRLFARAVNNRMDFALNSGDNHAFNFFTGGAWIDSTQSSVSGAYEMWAVTKSTANVVKVYRNAVEAYSNTHANGHDAIWSLGAPDAAGLPTDQYFVGDYATLFYHRRALSAQEIADHFAEPYDAFLIPGGDGEAGTAFNFSFFG